MYSLDCGYYKEEFNTVDELIEAVLSGGMDPNYELTYNGEPTGEQLFELMEV